MSDAEITRHIQSVDKYIWKLCHSSWERLPAHAKGYIDIDDLHAECLMYLWRQAPKWKSESASFITFAHYVCTSHLISHAERFQAKMRVPPVPIVSMTGLEGETIEVPDPRVSV